MAEAIALLGLISAVSGLANEGIKLSETIVVFATRIKYAGKESKKVASTIRSTSNMLDQLGKNLVEEKRTPVCTKRFYADTNVRIEECKEVFDELGSTLRKAVPSMPAELDDLVVMQTFIISKSEQLKWPFRQSKLLNIAAELESLKRDLNYFITTMIHSRAVKQQRKDKRQRYKDLAIAKLSKKVEDELMDHEFRIKQLKSKKAELEIRRLTDSVDEPSKSRGTRPLKGKGKQTDPVTAINQGDNTTRAVNASTSVVANNSPQIGTGAATVPDSSTAAAVKSPTQSDQAEGSRDVGAALVDASQSSTIPPAKDPVIPADNAVPITVNSDPKQDDENEADDIDGADQIDQASHDSMYDASEPDEHPNSDPDGSSEITVPSRKSVNEEHDSVHKATSAATHLVNGTTVSQEQWSAGPARHGTMNGGGEAGLRIPETPKTSETGTSTALIIHPDTTLGGGISNEPLPPTGSLKLWFKRLGIGVPKGTPPTGNEGLHVIAEDPNGKPESAVNQPTMSLVPVSPPTDASAMNAQPTAIPTSRPEYARPFRPRPSPFSLRSDTRNPALTGGRRRRPPRASSDRNVANIPANQEVAWKLPRPMSDREYLYVSDFDMHGRTCIVCWKLYQNRVYGPGRAPQNVQLCDRGAYYASDLTGTLRIKDGKLYSTIEDGAGDASVEVVLPQGYEIIRDLLTAIDSGNITVEEPKENVGDALKIKSQEAWMIAREFKIKSEDDEDWRSAEWTNLNPALLEAEKASIVADFKRKKKSVALHYARLPIKPQKVIDDLLTRHIRGRPDAERPSWYVAAIKLFPKRARGHDVRAVQVILQNWQDEIDVADAQPMDPYGFGPIGGQYAPRGSQPPPPPPPRLSADFDDAEVFFEAPPQLHRSRSYAKGRAPKSRRRARSREMQRYSGGLVQPGGLAAISSTRASDLKQGEQSLADELKRGIRHERDLDSSGDDREREKVRKNYEYRQAQREAMDLEEKRLKLMEEREKIEREREREIQRRYERKQVAKGSMELAPWSENESRMRNRENLDRLEVGEKDQVLNTGTRVGPRPHFPQRRLGMAATTNLSPTRGRTPSRSHERRRPANYEKYPTRVEHRWPHANIRGASDGARIIHHDPYPDDDDLSLRSSSLEARRPRRRKTVLDDMTEKYMRKTSSDLGSDASDYEDSDGMGVRLDKTLSEEELEEEAMGDQNITGAGEEHNDGENVMGGEGVAGQGLVDQNMTGAREEQDDNVGDAVRPAAAEDS